MSRNTDVHHVTVAGDNAHHVASEMGDENSPFYDGVSFPSVAQDIKVDGKLVGGIVEVWTQEHLTPAQEEYLNDNPNVIDVRHIWPK